MAIFSFKNKGKKAEEKKEDVVETVKSKPTKPYKPFSQHAAVDSLGQGVRSESSQDLEKISMASHMRQQNSTFDGTLADASYAQDVTVNMAPGASTPSSYKRKTHSNEAFTTHANDYFSPSVMRKLQANDPSLGYAKVAIARYDQGLAHYSSDSGYESAGPSRVPSEQNLEDMPRQYLTTPNLPELKLSDDERSERSSKSATKKTRFQVDNEPAAPLEQLPSQTMNLAALEGFKVNKKGKVLDEEGDIIGELVEGDLLDCVRQKINAKGEVLDDVGKVVGTVKLVTASLPSLTVVTPNGGSTSHSAEGESSPTDAPRSPIIETTAASQSLQDAPRRPARSASERSLSELSKPYARPPMSSVPENNVPAEDGILANPASFAYKGEIPAGPHQHIRRRSSSPPLLSPPSSIRRPNPRRISSGAVSSRSVGKQPVGYSSRRGPFSSYDTSPNGSDDGTETSNSDDGKFPAMSMYKRPISVRSVSTVAAKPRTYFTHAGRITVDPNEPATPLRTQALKNKPAAELKDTPAPVMPKEEKRKSRLSFLGKK